MQTLWNRVAQAQCRCHCPQCLSPAKGGVSRRAAGSATRRIPRFFTTSTFAYTSIFAAAATFDAGTKQDRREQWDRAIADVKQELGAEQHESRTASQQPTELDRRKQIASDASALHAPFGPDGDEDVFRYIDPRYPKPRWPTNTGPALQLYNLPPQSIYAASEVKQRAQRLQWTPKKMAITQVSFDMVQLTVFLRLQQQGWSIQAAQAVPDEYAKHMLHSSEVELKRLIAQRRTMCVYINKAQADLSDYQGPSDVLPMCRFSQDAEGNFLDTVRDLNLSLLELFRQHAQKAIALPALLAKLMYNISVCSAPPDVNTFNTLIHGLSDTKETQIVESIIKAIKGSCTRMNEVTLAAILKHYTDTNDNQRFIRWVELIRGKHNGLGLARPGINISDAGRSRLVRRPDDPSKVIQLPYPTPNVFAALITGMVKFGGFDAALQICDGMGHDGWGLCMRGLGVLLKSCAERGDWTRGLTVWKQIQALKLRSRRQDGGAWVSERIHMHTFADMLRLCSTRGERQVYDNVWAQAIKTYRYGSHQLLKLAKQHSGLTPRMPKHTSRPPTHDTEFRMPQRIQLAAPT